MNTTPAPNNRSWSGKHTRFPLAIRRAALTAAPICQACNTAPSTEVDHRHPVAEGGTNTLDNAQALCGDCHQAKTNAERRRGQLRRLAQGRHAPERHPGLRR